MSEKDEFLADVRNKGLSSPAGIHWDKLRRIILKYAKNDHGDEFPNPLILGGDIASHAVKHERLAEQLEWAESHGCLKEALTYLRHLPEDKWNISTSSDWGEEHPWVSDDES